MKEGCFLFVRCVYRGTLRWSTRKWVSEPPAAGLRVAEGGGGRLLFDMWQKKKKKNFHYFITFYSRLLSNMETVRWHRKSLWFIHCFLHNRIKQVCSFTLSISIHLYPARLSKRMWRHVHFVIVLSEAGLPLCLRKRWANSTGCANCAISLISTHSWEQRGCSPVSMCACVCLHRCSVTGDVGGRINHQTRAEVNTEWWG